MIPHGKTYCRAGNHVSTHYRSACRVLDALAYRYELFVGRPNNGATKVLLRWQPSDSESGDCRYLARAAESTLGEALDSIGAQVRNWAAGRTTQDEWSDAA